MRERVIREWKDAKTDAARAKIFRCRLHVWRPVMGEVRVWLNANFAAFEIDKPDFWTKKLVRRIPEEVLSKKEMNTLVSGGRKVR